MAATRKSISIADAVSYVLADHDSDLSDSDFEHSESESSSDEDHKEGEDVSIKLLGMIEKCN